MPWGGPIRLSTKVLIREECPIKPNYATDQGWNWEKEHDSLTDSLVVLMSYISLSWRVLIFKSFSITAPSNFTANKKRSEKWFKRNKANVLNVITLPIDVKTALCLMSTWKFDWVDRSDTIPGYLEDLNAGSATLLPRYDKEAKNKTGGFLWTPF